MKLSTAMRTALLIGGMVLVGCAGGDPDQRDTKPPTSAPAAPTPPATSPDLIDSDWVPDQGTHLLGSKPDSLATAAGYISVSTVPTFRTKFTLSLSAAADGAHLHATDGTTDYQDDASWFIGLTLTASDGGQIKIIGAAPLYATDLGYLDPKGNSDDGLKLSNEYVANPVASTEYTLVYRKPLKGGGFGSWQDYCDDGDAAVPLLGSYDATRAHRTAANAISFGCPKAIAFKCTMWGFPTGPTTSGDAWDRNTACTGMGNARYCGDAHSFTREMTPIWIVDNKPGVGIDDNGAVITHPGQRGQPDQWPGDPDHFYIEAGWRPDGTPICLSKLRWVSLPPNPCPNVLKDPRQVPSDHEETFFCDEKSVTDLFRMGATLVNGSPRMDEPMGRWKNSLGDTVSTARGVWVDANHDGMPDADTVLPVIGGSSDYTIFLGYDGMLLRNLTGTLDETKDMKLLYLQNFGAAGDHYLSDTGAGRSDPSFEGYSFQQQTTIDNENETIPAVPFRQCRWSASDTDTHLDGSSSTCVPVPGKQLGFALPAP